MRYCVIPVDQVLQEMIDESTMGVEDIKWSVDETVAILKFDCDFPNTMFGFPKLTQEQIKEEQDSPEWNPNYDQEKEDALNGI